MSDTAVIEVGGTEQEIKLTKEICEAIEEENEDFVNPELNRLVERVEELLYNIVDITPKDSIRHGPEVIVTDTFGDGSLDYGQPQKIDEADDVEIKMIRPDEIRIGWTDE